MKKCTLVLCLTAAIVAFTGAFVYAAGIDDFSDAAGHWAVSSLGRAAGENVLSGDNGYIRPDGTLTGAQMAAVLVRQKGLQAWDDAYAGTQPSDWYYRYAAIAAKAGILPVDGSVSMNGAVSREQVFECFVKAYFSENEQAILSSGMDSNTFTVLSSFSDSGLFSDEGRAAAAFLVAGGVVSGDDKGMLNPKSQITRAEFVTVLYRLTDNYVNLRNLADNYELTENSEDADSVDSTDGADSMDSTDSADSTESGIYGMRLNVISEDVQPGGDVVARVTFEGVTEEKTCGASWIYDGAAVQAYTSDAKLITSYAESSFRESLTFTVNMPLSHIVGFNLSYLNTSTGVRENLYAETFVKVTNYDKAHYQAPVYQKALATVSSKYKGNYTSSYNPDYSTEIKEAFVNGKAYSSRTDYLIWANLGTQKVNVFQGSQGEWELIKTFRCASGAPSTPTPTGVTYVTYKQTGWFNDSYVCRPVVRFYPGTGYAFHSILYKADGVTIKDGSMGFPVSHGCLRMQPSGIQWLYNYIPVNTTVVIY